MPDDISVRIAKASLSEASGKRSDRHRQVPHHRSSYRGNDSLRLLLEQAGIDAKVLLAQAGIDAKERELPTNCRS